MKQFLFLNYKALTQSLLTLNKKPENSVQNDDTIRAKIKHNNNKLMKIKIKGPHDLSSSTTLNGH